MNYGNPPFENRGGSFGYRVLEHGGGPGMLAWVIFALQLLILVGLAALLVSALAGPRLRPWARPFPGPGRGPGGPRPRHNPLDVVRMRYARGDIDREQYLQATHDLGGTPEDDAPTAELSDAT